MPVDPTKKDDTTPPPFDPKVFMGEIMTGFKAELNTTINVFDKKFKELEAKITTTPVKKEGEGDPPAEPKTIADLNAKLIESNKQIEGITKQLDEQTKARQKAEADALEQSRVSSFHSALEGLEFATPKAKQQFVAALLPSVKRAEDGSLFISNDKGEPIAMEAYVKTEYNDSTHLQPAPVRSGGAGVTAGSRAPANSTGFNYKPDMTPAQVAKLSEADKQAYRDQLLAVI